MLILFFILPPENNYFHEILCILLHVNIQSWVLYNILYVFLIYINIAPSICPSSILYLSFVFKTYMCWRMYICIYNTPSYQHATFYLSIPILMHIYKLLSFFSVISSATVIHCVSLYTLQEFSKVYTGIGTTGTLG